MAKKRYDENSALKSVLKVSGSRVERNGAYKYICIPVNALVGIHTWGKVDYLVHHCDYGLIRTVPKVKSNDTEDNNNRNGKKSRKEKSELKHKKNHRKMLQ